MKSFTIASFLAFATYVAAQANGGPPFDPSGAKNVGNGAGAQFIGGQCLSAADCGSGCCAGPSGICSGVGAQTQAGKTGCGFVSGAAPAPAAAATSPAAAAPVVAATTVAAAAPAGTQFITGACTVDADCASTCCGAKTGTCNALAVANGPGGGGCGGSGAAAAPAAPAPAAAAGTAVAGTASAGGPPFDPSGAKNVGNGAGAQFIGGQCLSAADCGSGCCAGPSGICSGVGAQTQAGKTGCGFVSKRFIARSRSFLL